MRERLKKIELIKVSHWFNKKDFVLDNISFSPDLGKTYVVQGQTGGGKSLLLKIMAGLADPSRGTVSYNGIEIQNLSFEKVVPFKMSMAFCFENGGLLTNKSLLDNLKLPLLFHKQWRAERSQKVLDELVESFQIAKFLNLRPASVPLGVRKIAGIMRSLLSNPQIIFFDEPSLGLGEDGIKVLKYWLSRFRKEGKGDELLFIASSDHKFMEQIEEKENIFIQEGRLILSHPSEIAG